MATGDSPGAGDAPGTRHLNEYLVASGGNVVCRRYRHRVCGTGENYKLALAASEASLMELSPVNGDPAQYVDDKVTFRLFFCPGCGTQVETEIILADLPPIWDVQLDAPRR